jgi:hypothetical protein
MKKILAAIVATVFLASFISTARAAEEKTIKGLAVCAKCELHETEKCQTAIKVKDGDKEVIYYTANNDVAKEFHSKICQAPAKVIATGTVKEKDGKKYIKLTKIELE